MDEDSTSHTNSVETPHTIQTMSVRSFSGGVKGKQPGSPPTVWDHFIKLENDGLREPIYECKYCGDKYSLDAEKCIDGTLWNHLMECKNNLHRLEDKRKGIPGLETTDVASGSSSNSLEEKLSRAQCIRACTEMIIIDELPITLVERKAFQGLLEAIRPDFYIPSPISIFRDAYQLYLDKRKQLKSFLSTNSQRVCLTVQTWTSIKNINYMALKVHFIDSDWELHKKILNFCIVPDDKEETVGQLIASCLGDWGIERVLTISVDNVSADDVAINYMKMKLKNLTGSLLDGEFLHMRCYTHIINLIINESLRDMHESIDSIRNAVKYVRLSPERLSKFKACFEHEIDCKGLMILDVPSRWNTTYLMLRDSLKFQKAFEKLEEDDEDYGSYFLEDESGEKMIGPPNVDDWENVRVLVRFLKIFYDVNLKFSASCVTSKIYIDMMCSIQSELTKLSHSQDSLLGKMATSIKRNYDKYWGSLDNNKLLIVSVVLDPRFKLDYVAFCFGQIYEDSMVEEMKEGVKELFLRLYEVYSSSESTRSGTQASNDDQCHYEWMSKFLEFKKNKGLSIRNEVDRYLLDSSENPEDDKFDTLHWWKANSTKYQILSRIARDVFAIPVSTMASSESAFSTGGCVLNEYWSMYPPKFVQALICSQDWLRSLPSSPVLVDNDELCIKDMEFYEELESGFFGLCPTTQSMDVD